MAAVARRVRARYPHRAALFYAAGENRPCLSRVEAPLYLPASARASCSCRYRASPSDYAVLTTASPSQETSMRYLCLAYYDEKKFDALPKPEVDALVRKCKAHDQELHDSGHLVLVASLGPTRSSTSIRPRGGKPWMTDGP